MRCAVSDAPFAACGDVRYVARLTWSNIRHVLLCEYHAAEERALGDVIEIRSVGRGLVQGAQNEITG